jgi:hypothetical protein
MGGKPQKNTPKDMRLSRNNPNAGKPTTVKVTKPMPVKKVGK